MNFSVRTQSKIKREKRDKYQDLARELKKKTRNMKVTVIPIVIGALETIHIGFVKRLEDLKIRGCVETIQDKIIVNVCIYIYTFYINFFKKSLLWCYYKSISDRDGHHQMLHEKKLQ